MVIAFVLAAATLALAGCRAGTDSAHRERGEPVVAGFYPLAWVAQQVGGRSVRVTDLTPPGAEPHDLELGSRDARHIRDADLVLYLGSGFQPALERAVSERTGPSLDLLAGRSVSSGDGADGDDAEGADPHVWLDPLRLASIAREVADALGRPGASDALVGRLRRLDGEFRRGLARCERRELVTSHAAFGYLAARYGLRQVALTGLSPESEPGPRTVARLVDEVRRTGATTVFFEPLLSPELARLVARESGARVAVLDPLEGLTAGQLETGADYMSVMRSNLAALREALGCR